jgi:hypothetical protein
VVATGDDRDDLTADGDGAAGRDVTRGEKRTSPEMGTPRPVAGGGEEYNLRGG